MAAFRIENHHRILTDAFLNDKGRKNVPDFYYNLMCVRGGSGGARDTIYKVPERVLTTFSSVLRTQVIEEAGQTPPDQWSHPISILISDASKAIMELVIHLLTTGAVEVKYQDVAGFQTALNALAIKAITGQDVGGHSTTNGVSEDHPPRLERAEVKEEDKTHGLNGHHRLSGSPNRVAGTNGNSHSMVRSHRTPSTSTGATSSPQSVYSGITPGQPSSNRLTASSGQFTANQVNNNLTQALHSYSNSFGVSGTPSASAASGVPNGSAGYGNANGMFECQVTGCHEMFTSMPESVKHYSTNHKIRVYKNNGEYKQIKI